MEVTRGEIISNSEDKYDSKTGWPSFTKPITQETVVLLADNSLFIKRTEVRSVYGDSHLGHVFTDGPQDKDGKRYCMNSASVKFIPKDRMEDEGYGDFIQDI